MVLVVVAALAAALLSAALAAASSKSERSAAYAAGIAAYVHGFPPLISRASQKVFPVNTLVGVARKSTPANRIVVLPNVDTVYTVSRLDLRAGPLIVSVPASPHRYYVQSSARGATPPLPDGTAFLSAFDLLLATDPPSAAERDALGGLTRFGIGAGRFGTVAALAADVRAALVRGIKAGPARVAWLAKQLQTGRGHELAGWEIPAADVGRYGSDWNQRAATAHDALWANTPDEAVYFMTERDGAGRSLAGRHRYELRFAHRLPARAFWSVTMYDATRHLYANPLNRYALGDRNLTPARNGSFTLLLQHPAPARGPSGWLPAPVGHFIVVLRLYVPAVSVVAGRWRPPGIVCSAAPPVTERRSWGPDGSRHGLV